MRPRDSCRLSSPARRPRPSARVGKANRAANACRESFNLYDEDYRGDPTTLVAALESDFDPMLERDDTCKRSSFEKSGADDQQMCQVALEAARRLAFEGRQRRARFG